MSKTHLKKYGPCALITGASSGIGKAFALELAREGFHLIVVARRQESLHELANSIQTQFPVQVQIIVADLATAHGVDLVRQDSHGEDVGLFIASAGFGTSGPFLDSSLTSESEMVAVNCLSLLQLTYEFATRMKQRGSGGIILMSSLLAWQAVPGSANYAATKAYVQSLAEGLSHEMKGSGIDVLASAPGPVLTEFGERAGMNITSGATPHEVATTSLLALGRKTTVVPGLLSKFLTASLALLPRRVRVSIMEKVMNGLIKET